MWCRILFHVVHEGLISQYSGEEQTITFQVIPNSYVSFLTFNYP